MGSENNKKPQNHTIIPPHTFFRHEPQPHIGTKGDGSDGDPESYHKKLLVTRTRSDRTHPSNVFSEPDIYQDTSGVSKANVVRGVGVAYQIIADVTWHLLHGHCTRRTDVSCSVVCNKARRLENTVKSGDVLLVNMLKCSMQYFSSIYKYALADLRPI